MEKYLENNYQFQPKIAIHLGKIDDVYSEELKNKLNILKENNITGMELNLTEFEQINPIEFKNYLNEFDVNLTKIATGSIASKYNLSLSDTNKDIRNMTIEKCKKLIEFASNFNAGIVFGYIKGGTAEDRSTAVELFKDSLMKLSEYSYNYQVPLIVEATNRYETSLANTVEEAVELIKGLDSPYLRVLPDTYHMNIEEINFSETLFKYFNYFDSLHLSDNNRFYPGYGSIDFYSLFRFLKCLNYKGTFAIEGNIKNNFESDLKVSLDMIKSIVSRL